MPVVFINGDSCFTGMAFPILRKINLDCQPLVMTDFAVKVELKGLFFAFCDVKAANRNNNCFKKTVFFFYTTVAESKFFAVCPCIVVCRTDFCVI